MLSTEERLFTVMQMVAEPRYSGTQQQGVILLPVLRKLFYFNKTDFDTAILNLRDAELIHLHHHDQPAALSEDEQYAFVEDDGKRYYIAAALWKTDKAERYFESLPEPAENPETGDEWFDEMVETARRWRGAALIVEAGLGGDKRRRLRLSRMTTKSDLDSYLRARYGVDAVTARDVSNTLTRLNITPDLSADISEFADEPWTQV